MILYHGTSPENADIIMKEGFKPRGETGKSNWDHTLPSQEDFIYLTIAYPFHFATAASTGSIASVIQVEVDEDDFYPDEDFIRQGCKFDNEVEIDITQYKNCGLLSMIHLGNCAVLPEAIKVIGRKDFKVSDMIYYSDPTISLMNFKIMSEYYKELTKRWWNDEDYQNINQSEMITKALMKGGHDVNEK